MFKFMINFLKILGIACLIGVSLRVIEVLCIKEETKELASNNTANEVRYEETLQIEDDKEKVIEEIVKQENIQEEQEKIIVETKKEAEIKSNKDEQSIVQQNVIVGKKEEEKIQIKNEQQEEKQQVSTKPIVQETIKQNVIEKEIPKLEEQKIEKQEETKIEENYTEIEVSIAERKECVGNKHGIDVGNTGKWFNTKEEAISTYKAEIKLWGNKWTNNEISDEEYYTNCPYGYEVWNCMYCGKWTLNYYYDK